MNTIPIPDEFVKMIIAYKCHLGGYRVNKFMKEYVYGVRPKDKVNILDINKMWNKLVLAARAFVSIEDPSAVLVISNKPFARRAVIKFCEMTGATPVTGRFIPGSFTNKEITGIKEPSLIIVSDTCIDKQAVLEASYVNTPCIAFCNTDNDLFNIDIALPMNNRLPTAIGASFFMLGRLINYMKGKCELIDNMKVDVEYFFYRSQAEIEKLAEENKKTERLENKVEVI
ncbi:40S ribosomal protein S0 [Astathelohania contejeani]|uniref:40S ribosomal protein S0 n=1 Tax=Astathelohania contejeani TaxID=164912 RepID=A0ABQ7I005_9MICR|nr:40S ribosomal protein S0 [Thelohania contejeani]